MAGIATGGFSVEGDAFRPSFYVSILGLGCQAGYHHLNPNVGQSSAAMPWGTLRLTLLEAKWFVWPRLALGVTAIDALVGPSTRQGDVGAATFSRGLLCASASYLMSARRRSFSYATLQLNPPVESMMGISAAYSFVPIAPLPMEAYVRAGFDIGLGNTADAWHTAIGYRVGLGYWAARQAGRSGSSVGGTGLPGTSPAPAAGTGWRVMGFEPSRAKTEAVYFGIAAFDGSWATLPAIDESRYAGRVSGLDWEARFIDVRYVTATGGVAAVSVTVDRSRAAATSREWVVSLGGGHVWQVGPRSVHAVTARIDLPVLGAALEYTLSPFRPLPIDLYAWAGAVLLLELPQPYGWDPGYIAIEPQAAAGVRVGAGWWLMRDN